MTIPVPLKAKLDRADESLRTFNDEYSRFSQRKPLIAAIDVDFQSGWNTAYIEHAEPIPALFSVLIGECLYHGRSALEHLVWALVKANHKKPGEHNSFPISVNRGFLPFLKHHRRPSKSGDKGGKLLGVPVGAAALIESLQPYHAQNPSHHPLAILDHMARDDRHRALHIAFTGGLGKDIQRLLRPTAGVRITDYKHLLRRGQRLVAGTKLARFRVVPLTRNPQVRVEGDFSTLIAFGGRGVPFVRLANFYDINTYLRHTISMCAKFL